MGMQKAPRELDLFQMAQWEVDVISANAHVCGHDLPAAIEMLHGSDIAGRVLGDKIALENLVPDGLVPLAESRAEGKILIDPAL